MENLDQTVDTLIKFLHDLERLNKKLKQYQKLKEENFRITILNCQNELIPDTTLTKEIFLLGLNAIIKDTKNLIEDLVKNRIQEVKNENSTNSQDQPN